MNSKKTTQTTQSVSKLLPKTPIKPQIKSPIKPPIKTSIKSSIKPPMKILRYVSDLHLEMRQTINHPKLLPLWKFKKDLNDRYFLALCGDIGNPSNPNLREFLANVSVVYEKIFYIPGNHEYYNWQVPIEKSWNEIHKDLESICNEFNNNKYY